MWNFEFEDSGENTAKVEAETINFFKMEISGL